MLQDKMKTLQIEWAPIWNQIITIIIKSLVACQIEVPYCPNSFELFGYDIIIDKNLQCKLLGTIKFYQNFFK
jgi:hypothetical protein